MPVRSRAPNASGAGAVANRWLGLSPRPPLLPSSSALRLRSIASIARGAGSAGAHLFNSSQIFCDWEYARGKGVLSAMPWWLEALGWNRSRPRRNASHPPFDRSAPKSKPTHGTAVQCSITLVAGTHVATSRDTTARVWDLQTGEPLTPWLRHSNKVEQVLFSRSGNLLLTRETQRSPIPPKEPDQGEGAASVWQLPQGQLLFRLPHTNVVRHAEFSADDQPWSWPVRMARVSGA